MLTFVEAISLAGDRAKQNDDAFGHALDAAWVIDGATDLHDEPLTGWASDASWLAASLNDSLHTWVSAPTLEGGPVRLPRVALDPHEWLRNLLRLVADDEIAPRFRELYAGYAEHWRQPIASLLLVREVDRGITGLDLGDCRILGLDAAGRAFTAGGAEGAVDNESALAAKQTDKDKPLLRRTETIEKLRRMRAELNQAGSQQWTFCLDPACADHARAFAWTLARPAHVLLMTDGFSALTDRYRAYDAAGLVQAALTKGLQELGRELREIENADETAAVFPRFKKSDDATALLMRLT